MPVSSRFVHPLDQEALQRSRVVFSLGTIAALFCLLFRAGTEIPQDGQRSQWASLLSAVVVLLLGPPILSAFASGLEHLSLRQWRQRQSECLDYLGLSLAAGLLALMIWFVLPLPVLRGVGRLLNKAFRASDYIFRFGGGKFMVLLPDTPAEGAAVVVRGLQHTLRNEADLTKYLGRPLVITISQGTYVWPNSLEEVIDQVERKVEITHIGRDIAWEAGSRPSQ